MNLDQSGGRRSPSPTSSGRSTPVPRAFKRAAEDGIYKADRSLRRFAVTIERALASWETSPQEWADYIAFLGRLLKAIQSHPKEAPILPHSTEIASKLAQCLNPALPSGVHQKALEVYAQVFDTFGQDWVASHLNEFLPGLSSVLSFASLSVRPGLYSILEDHVVRLSPNDLRPALKSLILSLLPALEEESEDFDRAFRILDSLERALSSRNSSDQMTSNRNGYFWQCLFLAIITSPSRRQGALNYLSQRLPKFSRSRSEAKQVNGGDVHGSTMQLSPDAQVVISPEPGLLIRAFACGLADPQVLIQRGFLDLLVTHLPLDSLLLRSRVGADDLDSLVSAAIKVLLRREMSLNRRLWSWFLGPDPKADATESLSTSPSLARKDSTGVQEESQYKYFLAYGSRPLQRCVMAMFKCSTASAAQRARPFRICLSFMDRWEIGGSIVPHVFIPAMRSAHQFSLQASLDDLAELLRSASLFFDGIEASLIWANLFNLLGDDFSQSPQGESLQLFSWVVQHFNIKDEEMLTTHVPYAAIYLSSLLVDSGNFAVSARTINASLELVSVLVELLPERAFVPSHKHDLRGTLEEHTTKHPQAIRDMLDEFYRNTAQSRSTALPIGPDAIAEILYQLTRSFMLEALHAESDDTFNHVTSLLLALYAKLPTSMDLQLNDSFDNIHRALDKATREGHIMTFPAVSSIISLVTTMSTSQRYEQSITKDRLVLIEPALTAQLWRHLSPSSPKFNVEAVKSVWQLQDLVLPGLCLEASLTALVRQSRVDDLAPSEDRVESIRRFAVLWNHSVPAPRGTKTQLPASTRRASTMPGISDPKQGLHRQKVLTEPLMLVLDSLRTPTDAAYDVVNGWLHSLSSLEQVYRIHFDLIETLLRSWNGSDGHKKRAQERIQAGIVRQLEYVVNHFYGILESGNSWQWQCLDEISVPFARKSHSINGMIALAEYSIRFLNEDGFTSPALQRNSVKLIELLLLAPTASSLKCLDLDSQLINYMTKSLSATQVGFQGPILKLIKLALRLRMMSEPANLFTDGPPGSSVGSNRPYVDGEKPNPNAPGTGSASIPPPQLLACLILGLSAKACRTHLDQWIEFLSDVLPTFAGVIFANLIPLVECICGQLDSTLADLVSLAKTGSNTTDAAPEATAIYLLDALDMTLGRAHDCLIEEQNNEPVHKPAAHSRGLLSNMASGVFKAEGLPSRTSQSNSRLTVVLIFHDAMRVASKLWVWASHSTAGDGYDKSSAATTSYNALRVRNRTRHLMEEIFAIEPLESLEVVVSKWCYTEDLSKANAALALLHVINGLRPKNIIPAILDALCSRTNSAALPLSRQSSQTIELDVPDVALFLAAYLRSIEDDAMDEVWSDCMAFFRDILSNPLPYRQILPSLLSVVMLLAQKVDNTNFGEQRKMRRDLGDTFTRLLAATFTTISAGQNLESGELGGRPDSSAGSNAALGHKAMGLLVVLQEATAHIEVVLETSDRAMSAINSISSGLIGPMLRSKAFPLNMSSEFLALLLQISRTAPAAKPWRKELLDAFNDPRFLASSTEQMEKDWFPVLHQWCLHDKERMPDLLFRLSPPSSAGIMFGVGATAARLEADRKTQLNIRRICVILLACPEDTFVAHSRTIEEKLVELFEASGSSSPSIAIKAELFMLCRSLVLSTSTVQLSPFWPVINDNLQAALLSLSPSSTNGHAFANLSLVQACKLLDLLVALSPDEFQLHEWLYITDTIDAVYQPSDWAPSALSDQIAEVLASDGLEDGNGMIPPTPMASSTAGRRRTLIGNGSMSDKGDLKAMTREDFARAFARPFLSQLSIHAYEGVYSMETPDRDLCRRGVLEDILDPTTIME